MDSIFVIRGRVQELYASHSRIFDKAVQFIVALAAFYLINDNVGFLSAAASPVATLALSIICTFFPPIITVLVATALILAHMYAVSLGVLAVTAMVFLIMYIFYFRLTPKMAMVVLLTPIAFMLKIPYVIPIAYALMSTPICLVAISCGTIVYYMLAYVKTAAAGMEGEGAVFQSNEMWVVIVAFIICFLLVYTLRRQAMDHAWKIAIGAGAVANVILIVIGDIALGVHTSYVSLILGNVAAVIAGLILELFFFSVDYARSENLQYEDDEYYYYVKAVPKLSVATPEKTVKRINERQETEIIDPKEVRRRAGRVRKGGAPEKGRKERPMPKKGPSAKRHDMEEVDKMLLTQSLKNDLDLGE